jgi:hypothetical protein
MPTTSWDSSSGVEIDAGPVAVLFATFDTAVGAGLDEAPRPADTDFAGALGLGVPEVFDV